MSSLLHCGTKKVMSTSGQFANSMASSLLMVESPSLVDLRSDASVVTCKLPGDGCSSL